MPIALRPLPPLDAIAALEARGRRLHPSFRWQEVYAELHAAAFTVAKSAGFDILADIHAALDDALREGTTADAFRRRLVPILQRKGWWGRQAVIDPATGLPEVAQLGSTRRLELIFDVNMRVSYAAGHWESFERNKRARPWLRYVAIMDERTRPTHALHHNLVLPVDHPYWDVWAPPCGWNCRCTLQSLSQRDVDAMRDQLKFEPPLIETRPWRNKWTGEVRHIPEGIDPGWDYNPGKAAHEHRHRAALSAAEKLIAAPPALAAHAMDEPAFVLDAIAAVFPAWFNAAVAGTRVTPATIVAGVLRPAVLEALSARGIAPQSAAITLAHRRAAHMQRDAIADHRVPADVLRRLPMLLAAPRAVLRDLRTGQLLYVVDVPGSARRGKVVVTLDFVSHVSRSAVSSNSIRTAGLVEERVLRDARTYELLVGEI